MRNRRPTVLKELATCTGRSDWAVVAMVFQPFCLDEISDTNISFTCADGSKAFSNLPSQRYL